MKKQKTKINVNPVGATSSRPHFEEKTQNNKGITLIALIVTIIVMLILVGVTVNVALNGGLFDIAKQATAGMTMAQIKERAEVVKAILVADAQTDNTIRLSKQEYRDRLLQEFEGSTAYGYKVIVDERYVINIQNTDLDISVTDLNQQENTSTIDPRTLTTLSYTTSNVEENEKKYVTNVEFTLTKASMTSGEYQETKMAEYNSQTERTQEEKNKLALEYAADFWYGTEEKFETLDKGVVYAINDYYGTTYKTIEECLASENVQAEWGKTIGQLYYNFYYYEIVNTVPELTEQETLDLFYYEVYAEEQNAKKKEYTTEYSKYTVGLRLYVSKDGGEEKLVTTTGISIARVDKIVNYSILENGTYEFVLRTNSTSEEILREKIEVRDMATDKNPYYVTAEDAEGVWTTDGAGTITGYTGTDTEVIVPLIIDGETIISAGGFKDNTNITNVTIPEGITQIGNYAFQGCTNLTNVEIPEGVTKIGYYSFASCTSLEGIDLPQSLIDLSINVFESCTDLKSIIIPDNVKSISDEAFKGCTSLTNISLPYGLTSIGAKVFWRCTNLASITIPETVTEIQYYAFRECKSLTEVTIPEGVNRIGELAFYYCTNLNKITIPKTVILLERSAFGYCSNLKEVILNEGVATLGYKLFIGCKSLTTITIPNSVVNINKDSSDYSSVPSLFEGCTNLTTINFAPGSNSIPKEQYAPWGAPNENVKVTKLTQTTSEE